MQTLKLMADYACWPLWLRDPIFGLSNVDPRSLDIDPALVDRLIAWATVFDGWISLDAPGSELPLDAQELAAFEREGRELWRSLIEALPRFRVVYKGPRSPVEYSDPRDLPESD